MKKINFDRYIKPDTFIYILFLGGFLVGMILAFVIGNNGEGNQLYWLNQPLMYLKYGEIQYSELLYYILQKRLSLAIFLGIICLSYKGKYILYAGVALAGGFVGYFIILFIAAKGILGSLLFMISVFPHYICYGYGYYCLLTYKVKIEVKREKNINRISQNEYDFYENKKRNFIKKMLPIAVVIIGVLFECYVNPFFLKLFVKIFM